MGVSLDLGLLKSRLNSQSPLKEVQGGPHLSDTSVVASHVIESHGLTEFVVLTELFRLLEQVEGRVDIFLFEVVDGQNVTDLTELFAGA